MNRYLYPNFKRPPIDYIEVGQFWLNKNYGTGKPGLNVGFRIINAGPRDQNDKSLFWGNSIWRTKEWFLHTPMPATIKEEYIYTGGCGFLNQEKFREGHYLAPDFKGQINDDGYVCSNSKGMYSKVHGRFIPYE